MSDLPADRFGTVVDSIFVRSEMTLPARVALVVAAEAMIVEALAAAVDSGIISDDQAGEIMDLAAGPVPRKRPRLTVVADD